MCDHAKWASALGLKRIIHRIEANEQQGTECAPRRPCMSASVPLIAAALAELHLIALLTFYLWSRDVAAAYVTVNVIMVSCNESL